MSTCLQDIVSIKDLCPGADPVKSSSGYDIWQAPEIKYRGVAAITDEKYVRGRNMLLNARDVALLEVQSDFLKTVLMSGYGVNPEVGFVDTGTFKPNIQNPAAPLSRGISIHAAKPSVLRKLKIHEVHVFPVESVATIELKLWDNGNELSYPVQLIGGQQNTFLLDYAASGNVVRIYLDNTALNTYSSSLTCLIGCGGTMPNECGYVKGWNGTGEVKSEGFGINASFTCECDYTQLLCAWSKQFIGEIVWYKMRALVQQERLNSDRLNNFTIYNREEAEKKQVEFENTYRVKWNEFTEVLPKLLKGVRDSCLDCNRTKWVTNV